MIATVSFYVHAFERAFQGNGAGKLATPLLSCMIFQILISLPNCHRSCSGTKMVTGPVVKVWAWVLFLAPQRWAPFFAQVLFLHLFLFLSSFPSTPFLSLSFLRSESLQKPNHWRVDSCSHPNCTTLCALTLATLLLGGNPRTVTVQHTCIYWKSFMIVACSSLKYGKGSGVNLHKASARKM